MLEAGDADFGVELSIDKGVPMSAGMGGSAASAVAAAAAANALLPHPFTLEELLPFAIEGERVSSDPPPWDNVIAALYGGLVLGAREETPVLIQRLPVPAGIVAILLHPDAEIETRAARGILKAEVPMRIAVEHSRKLASFVAGCATGDLGLIRAGLEDIYWSSRSGRICCAALPIGEGGGASMPARLAAPSRAQALLRCSPGRWRRMPMP